MFRGKNPKTMELVEAVEVVPSKVDWLVSSCLSIKRLCLTYNCASACTKIFLVVVNFAFLMSGWLLLGLGAWLHLSREYLFFSILLKDNLMNPILALDRISTSLVLIGCFIVVLSFLGCCGACTDSVCFLTFYAFLLLITIALQITLAALAPSFQKKIISDVGATMQHQIRHQYNFTAKLDNKSTPSSAYELTRAWDSLQMKLNCCGAHGPIDYRESSWYNHTNFADGSFVPTSCCAILSVKRHSRKSDAQCQVEAIAAIMNFPNITSDHHHIRSKGCLNALIDWLRQFEYLGWFLHVIIILQIVDFIYACILLSWLKKSLVDYTWCEDDDFQ